MSTPDRKRLWKSWCFLQRRYTANEHLNVPKNRGEGGGRVQARLFFYASSYIFNKCSPLLCRLRIHDFFNSFCLKCLKILLLSLVLRSALYRVVMKMQYGTALLSDTPWCWLSTIYRVTLWTSILQRYSGPPYSFYHLNNLQQWSQTWRLNENES